MLKVLLARIRQRHRTIAFPRGGAPPLPVRFAGLPKIDASRCAPAVSGAPCVTACPVGAITATPSITLDMGACLFCRACERACPHGAISFSRDYRTASGSREGLLVVPTPAGAPPAPPTVAPAKLPRRFRKSLRIRQVSAGGCNACEADVNVLSTVGWDIGRFGIQIVASPRHADALLVTGPVTQNMKLALEKSWAAVAAPRVVIAVGSCAIAGGPYRGHPEANDGVSSLLPVDLYVPGSPPHPLSILDGMLRLLGRTDAAP